MPYPYDTTPQLGDNETLTLKKLLKATVDGGGGGGGGAVTVANGADVTQGAIADAAVVNPANSGSLVALAKGILTQALAILAALVAPKVPGLAITAHDYIGFTYVASGAADNDRVLTQVFKTGGSGGTTVATLTFAYSGSTNNVTSITKT